MSKASDYAAIAKQCTLEWTGFHVSARGNLEIGDTEYLAEFVPELIAWLIDTFDVELQLPSLVYPNPIADDYRNEAELLRRKLARAMETLRALPDPMYAERILTEIEAMR